MLIYTGTNQGTGTVINKTVNNVLTYKLLMSFTPTSAGHLVSKGYVDSNIPTIPLPSTLVRLDGGNVVTGTLELSSDPVSNDHAVTKGYMINQVSSSVAAYTPNSTDVNNAIAVNPRLLKSGDVIKYPSTTGPSYFLRCNGGVVSKSSYGTLYAAIGDQYNMPILTPGAGQPWRQQNAFNSAQSGDITGWTTGTALPTTIANSHSLITNNKVYLLGGYAGGAESSTVYTAAINSDGTLAGWSSLGAILPGTMSLGQLLVYGSKVYIFGGRFNSSASSNIIYTCTINVDGSLGTWSSAGTLPAVLNNVKGIITSNKIHIIGGDNGTTQVNTVYTCTVNVDGTLSSWTTSSPLTHTTNLHGIIVTPYKVYVCGGYVAGTQANNVCHTNINADGTLGTWVVGTPLPVAAADFTTIITSNKAYIISGLLGGTYSAAVYNAPINADGTLGTWVLGTSVSASTTATQAIVTSSKVYLLGGYAPYAHSSVVHVAPFSGGRNNYMTLSDITIPSSKGQPWRQQSAFNKQQSGDITGWTQLTDLPVAPNSSCVIVTINKVYILGGWTSSVYSPTVYQASIDSSGVLGTWSVSSNSLVVGLSESQAVIANNKVYLIGGINSTGELNTIYTSTIATDGTIGTWSLLSYLPYTFRRTHAVVVNNRLHLIGGIINGVVSAAVYTCLLNNDGTLGAWTTGTSLPVTIDQTQVINTGTRLYTLSGMVNGTLTNAIAYKCYTALINSDGTLGAWSESGNTPYFRYMSQSIVTGNTVYMIGGNNGTYVGNVYYCPINSDGTLGTWVTSANDLPGSRTRSQVIATSNKIYVLTGEVNGSPSTAVNVASFAGGRNDYISLPVLAADSTQFTLPNLTASDASSTGLYSYIKT